MHPDCEHGDTFGEIRDCIERQISEIGDPGLLASLDQLDAKVSFRRDQALFGPSTQ